MVKKLTKHGNSYALIIDKPIMDLLNITPDSPLEISTDGKSLIIRPAATTRPEKFDKVLAQTTEFIKTHTKPTPPAQ